ncbi:MAG: hypothetical protein MZV70_05875 [Desulfobacterales bacterium]|nr:hypothetical protein [Desulfobacterales bacterium]
MRVYVDRGSETRPATTCKRRLVSLQYERNDAVLERGRFRVRGDVLEIYPAYAKEAYRIELDFDTRSSASASSTRSPAQVARGARRGRRLPGQALRHARGRRCRAPSRASATELDERYASFMAAEQARRGPAAQDPHRVRPRDARGDGLLPGHRELLRHLWRAAAGRAARRSSSTTSPRTS